MTSGVWVSDCYQNTCFIRIPSTGGFSGIYFEAVVDDKYPGVLVGLRKFVFMRTLTTSVEHYFL